MIQKQSLSIYQCIAVETGPVIALALTIKEDFTWMLSYRTQVVPREYCELLESIYAYLLPSIQVNKFTIIVMLHEHDHFLYSD